MNKTLQQFVGVALMTGGILVGLLCVLAFGASVRQPLSAEAYVFWTVLLACCLASIVVSLYLRLRYKKSVDNDR